jgi:myosin heavy subunit
MLARKLARSMRQQRAAVIIQTAWRRHQIRLQYQHMLHNIVAVQALWRGVRARMQYADLRQQHAATVLQSNWRRHTQQSAFQELRAAAVVLQGAYRWAGVGGSGLSGVCRVCQCEGTALSQELLLQLLRCHRSMLLQAPRPCLWWLRCW